MTQIWNESHFDLIWKYTSDHFLADINGCHGINHWKRVELNGLIIAQHTGADETVVRLFAPFHDAMRKSDNMDEGHGAKAAELVTRLRNNLFTLDEARFELLYYACKHHADGTLSTNPTVGTCWDADRLDIWRVNADPEALYMSTVCGKKLAKKY